MKFLCDQMLSKLGKWLRAAGYDTVIVNTPLSDMQILKQSIEEKRLLLTRDRHFLTFKDAQPHLIFLKGNDFEAWIREINESTNINWLFAPFSRCLLCNSSLKKISKKDLNPDKIPEKVYSGYIEFLRCLKCDKVYWLGSHAAQMEEKLKQFQGEKK